MLIPPQEGRHHREQGEHSVSIHRATHFEPCVSEVFVGICDQQPARREATKLAQIAELLGVMLQLVDASESMILGTS